MNFISLLYSSLCNLPRQSQITPPFPTNLGSTPPQPFRGGRCPILQTLTVTKEWMLFSYDLHPFDQTLLFVQGRSLYESTFDDYALSDLWNSFFTTCVRSLLSSHNPSYVNNPFQPFTTSTLHRALSHGFREGGLGSAYTGLLAVGQLPTNQ